MLAEDVGVNAQGHGGIGVAEANSGYVDRDACEQQRGREQVAQVMQPCPRQRLDRGVTGLLCRLIILVTTAVTVSSDEQNKLGSRAHRP